MITIEKLDIQLDVAGEENDSFSRLFAEHMRRWEAQASLKKERSHRARMESGIGGSMREGMNL